MNRKKEIRDGKDVLVQLRRTEIVYDVSFASWAHEDEHMLTDKMADFIDRQVKSATSILQSRISFVRVDRTQMRTDDIMEHTDGWVIVLRFPNEWRGSAELLQDHVHRYVAGYVVQEWMRLKAKDREQRMAVADKQTEVESALNDVVTEAYKMKRINPTWDLEERH